MPGLASDHATLGEVLEVRAEPLNEEELWSVLFESGNALKSVLRKIEQERLVHLSLTLRPDTLLLCLNGKIKFAITKHAKANRNFIAPESFADEGKYTISKIEKMLVYCLGMTVLAAAENGLEPDLNLQISRKLEQLMNEMVEDKYHRRCSVDDIIQTCKRQMDIKDCYKHIRLLAIEIVGPYGLQPLSKFPSIPQLSETPNKTKKTFDESVESLAPLSSLPPVKGEKGNAKDYTDGYASGSPGQVKRKPPVMKNSLTPRYVDKSKKLNDEPIVSKPWSPTYSSPDLKTLLQLENEKMKLSGYLRDEPRMLLSPNKSLSMPSLNDVEDSNSERSFQAKPKKIITKDHKNRDQYRSTGFINRASSITSHNSSSQMSLTHGAYVLDSDPVAWSQEFPMRRYNSGSSLTKSDSGPQSFFNLPLRPPNELDLKEIGPEFVRIAKNPEKALVDLAPPRLGPLPKGTRKISVNLPNSQQLQLNVLVSSKAKEVFDKVAEYISLKETSLFGVTQVQDGEELFLDLDVKLSKYAPTGWKDDNSKKKKTIEFILYFRVKYFLQDPRMIKHCLTIHMYYLQLRQFLLSGYIQCPDDILINLTSYALQAEYGDFHRDYQGVEYFKKEFYIPGKVLSRLNRVDLLRNLPMLHQTRSGMSPEEAELAFLNEIACLPEYGVLFYRVSRSKKNESDYVWLGIRIKGIVVLEPKGLQRSTVHEQAWDLIREFTFEKKKFVVKPKKPDESPKLVFYTNHYRKSKYLFKLCQSFHRFEVFTSSTRMNQVITRPIIHKDKFEDGNKTTNKGNKIERKVVFIHITKTPPETLGLVIVGGQDSKRLTSGIYIKHIKPNSVCELDGRLNEGDKIISVNGISLEDSTHEEAAQTLKRAGNELDLVISKAVTSNISLLEKSGLSPGLENSQVVRYKNWDSVLGEDNDHLKKKLEGIELVDDEDESEDQFSERPIDVPDDKSHPMPPSSDYDDPAALERTMDDIVMDLAAQQHDFEDRPPPPSSQEAVEEVETPRAANIIVNSVEITDGGEDETSFRSSASDKEEDYKEEGTGKKLVSNLKRFGGFEALDRLESDISPASSLSQQLHQMEQENSDRINEQSFFDRTLDQTLDEVEVDLEKINGSFGFSVQGGKESNLPLGSIYVKQVYSDGAAWQSKRIREGDRLLAVNGISLGNILHEEAVTILKKAPQKSTITFDRSIELPMTTTDRRNNESDKDEEHVDHPVIEKLKKEEKVFQVSIRKRHNGLGLSLVGGRDSDMCYGEKLMIKKLFPGHAMHNSDRFLIGDILLAINDQILDGMTYQEAIAVIRSSPKDVTIIAKRPRRDEIPSELFETSRPVSPEKLLKDSKHLSVSGRSTSREGHRIAKELLQSLGDVDETSIDIPLSSIMVTHSHQLEEDATEAFTDDPDGDFDGDLLVDGDEVEPSADSRSRFEDSLKEVNMTNKEVSPLDRNQLSEKPGDFKLEQTSAADKVKTQGSGKNFQASTRSGGFTGESDLSLLRNNHQPLLKRGGRVVSDLNDEGSDENEQESSESVSRKHKDCVNLGNSKKMQPRVSSNKKREKKEEATSNWSDFDDDDNVDGVDGENLNVTTTIRDHLQRGNIHRDGTYSMDSLDGRHTDNSESSSVIGIPRHRPPVTKKQLGSQDERVVEEVKMAEMKGTVNLEAAPSKSRRRQANKEQQKETPHHLYDKDVEERIEMQETVNVEAARENPQTNTAENYPLVQETGFVFSNPSSPRHRPSPILYPKSPSALKNLNASPSKDSLVRQYSSTSKGSSTGEIISIQLEKGGKGLGITLATDNTNDLVGDDDGSFVFIKKLVPGSVAEQSGRLKTGDRIMTVNGKNVEELSQKDIIGIFRTISGTISMEFFRAPDHPSPSHHKSESAPEDNIIDNTASLTLPQTPSLSPTKQQQQQFLLQQMDGEEGGGNSFGFLSNDPPFPANSSTPFILDVISDSRGGGAVSEDITFNSNDGLSFADDISLLDDEEKGSGHQLSSSNKTVQPSPKVMVQGRERLIQMTSPPVAARPYEAGPDSDSESLMTHNDGEELSEMEGLNEFGILLDQKINNPQQQLPPKNPLHRPKSAAGGGSAPARSSTRSVSGIPRPIRSRSNSLTSNDSGGQSRRNSSELSTSRLPPRVDMDKSFDCFVQRSKDFNFYNSGVVNTILLSLEKKMQVTNLNAEFMALRQLKCLDPCDAGNRASNRSKNRIKTLLPYDKNRVQLAGGEESDYINASLVKLPLNVSKPSQYIVAQAPLESTVCDFWRCIWEKKVEVVVMLTREEENGKIKCHKYWPSVKKTPMRLTNKFTIELLYEEFNGSFIYRQIQIHNMKMDKSLFITQACFTQWPDIGVPKDSIEFLGFTKFVRNFSSSAITMVHCSAGVGRSGIYVVVDALWNLIEQDKKVDVAKLIQEAKEQRTLLIQTKEQYSFIYNATKELFQDLDNALTIR